MKFLFSYYFSGQKYFDRNALGLLTSYLAGLIAVFVVPSITEVNNSLIQ